MNDIPAYRAQRIATEDEAEQWIINLCRRLLFLPVLKTGAERYREALCKFDYHAYRWVFDPKSWVISGEICRHCGHVQERAHGE